MEEKSLREQEFVLDHAIWGIEGIASVLCEMDIYKECETHISNEIPDKEAEQIKTNLHSALFTLVDLVKNNFDRFCIQASGSISNYNG